MKEVLGRFSAGDVVIVGASLVLVVVLFSIILIKLTTRMRGRMLRRR